MKKETEEWIKIAGEDYVSAKCLFGEELYRMVCYHSQQVVEKVLKAFLVEEGVDFARTHNLIDFNYKIFLKNLKKYDCLVLVTEHSCYDYPMIKKYSSLIVDTRNVFKITEKKMVKA